MQLYYFIKNLREKIISLGGEFRFNTCLTNINVEDNKLKSIEVNNNEIIDSGYYKQDESVITLADTEEGLSEAGAYTLQANDKGYVVTIKLDNENKIFAKYQYSEQE